MINTVSYSDMLCEALTKHIMFIASEEIRSILKITLDLLKIEMVGACLIVACARCHSFLEWRKSCDKYFDLYSPAVRSCEDPLVRDDRPTAEPGTINDEANLPWKLTTAGSKTIGYTLTTFWYIYFSCKFWATKICC